MHRFDIVDQRIFQVRTDVIQRRMKMVVVASQSDDGVDLLLFRSYRMAWLNQRVFLNFLCCLNLVSLTDLDDLPSLVLTLVSEDDDGGGSGGGSGGGGSGGGGGRDGGRDGVVVTDGFDRLCC